MKSGWIGVDLDGTLAEYHGWGDGSIGKPIPLMVERIKGWLAEGTAVKIFTARATDADETKKVVAWCVEHLGTELPVTCLKDFACIEIWDDRAIQVKMNTGVAIGEYLQTERKKLG